MAGVVRSWGETAQEMALWPVAWVVAVGMSVVVVVALGVNWVVMVVTGRSIEDRVVDGYMWERWGVWSPGVNTALYPPHGHYSHRERPATPQEQARGQIMVCERLTGCDICGERWG